MLNPNYNPSEDETNLRHNHTTLVIPVNTDNKLAQDEDNALTVSDHCHVVKPNDLLDKKRHAIVWRKLISVLILCTLFMVSEIVGGLLANSISIQTDAAHMAADIAGFFFSILAIYISTKG